MYNESYNTTNSSKSSKTRLKITKKNLIDFNDYILNFQRYYELIKNNPILLTNKKRKDLDIYNIDVPNNKKNPYNKLQNDISTIYKRISTDINNEKNNNYKMQYLYNNYNYFNTKISPKKNKVYKSIDKSKDNFDNNNTNINNNTYKNNFVNKNFSVERNKYEYGNYAMNNTNFNHPQLYMLKINKSYDIKNKLPKINYKEGFKINRTNDLANLIPKFSKKDKYKNNFYNYYLGLKHSKQKFNI